MSINLTPYVLPEQVRSKIASANVLVVGAGGIGCEILKNLVLSGFENIEIIDLDTIDVSNLNRQFLFRKEHVGKSKAVVARESVLAFNPKLNIKAYHDSITIPEYGVNFYKKFDLVLNALDNRVARNHVNRMCLAADIPLVESGTSGYTGQVEFIKKGLTQCYECQPKPPQKSFPGCTIRNTPSEPVHCIVWAKHLFNQLFGEADADQDVSPDTADPEAAGSAGVDAANNIEQTQRTSTNQWAKDINYDPTKLFNKFFENDIKYLLSMDKLWKSRNPPNPLSWSAVASHGGDIPDEDGDNPKKDDMQIWSLQKCAKVFASTIYILKENLKNKQFLIWDKDDKPAMDFVTACANIRAHVFSISQKSRFDVKSIAGNIVPAIATTNAIVAGLAVLDAFRILAGKYEKCCTTYIRQKSSMSKTVLMTESVLIKANLNCYVCSEKPTVYVSVDVDTMTVKEFETEILKNRLNMIAPDAILEGKNIVIISSEEGETEANNNKKLKELGIVDGAIVKVDDFLQNYELTIYISKYVPNDKNDPPFVISAKAEDLVPRKESAKNGMNEKTDSMETNEDDQNDLQVIENVQNDDYDPQEGSSTKRRKIIREESDLIMLDD